MKAGNVCKTFYLGILRKILVVFFCVSEFLPVLVFFKQFMYSLIKCLC